MESIRLIQEGNSKRVAKILFLGLSNPTSITRIIYPDTEKYKKSYTRDYIKKYFDIWNKAGYLHKGTIFKKIIKKDKKPYKLSFNGYIFNFKPIFEYCKLKGYEFTSKEKRLFNEFFNDERFKFKILERFPNDDIIIATLKCYAKFGILKEEMFFNDLRSHYYTEMNERHKYYLKYNKDIIHSIDKKILSVLI